MQVHISQHSHVFDIVLQQLFYQQVYFWELHKLTASLLVVVASQDFCQRLQLVLHVIVPVIKVLENKVLLEVDHYRSEHFKVLLEALLSDLVVHRTFVCIRTSRRQTKSYQLLKLHVFIRILLGVNRYVRILLERLLLVGIEIHNFKHRSDTSAVYEMLSKENHFTVENAKA